MEHLHHFGLGDDPFRKEPRLQLFLETRPIRESLQRLERGLRQSKGLCVLVGAVGSGKTMLVRRLLENLEEEIFEASMLVVLNGATDSGWILTRFARQLGIEEPAREREALLAQVYEQLAIVREDGRHAVLIVDDAQALASQQTLAEVCGLLKLEYEDRGLLSLVLAGVPRLDEAITADPLLARRVDVKVRLEALDPSGTAEYLGHRIRRSGGNPAILDDGALAALQELGGGLPGQMNTLADNALFEAYLCGRQRMTRVDVERAYRDLGWNGPAAASVQPAEIDDPIQRLPAAEVDELETPEALPGETPLEGTLGDLDSELEAVFANAEADPLDGPPKTEEEVDDLLVELIDD